MLLVGTTLSIALGVGINLGVYGVLRRVLFEPSIAAAKPDELLRVGPELSYPTFRDLRASGIFESLAASQMATLPWQSGDGTTAVAAGVVSANFFEVLGVRPLLGRGFDDARDAGGTPTGDAAMLSFSFWQRRFAGDPAAIGQTMTLNGWPFTVVGVLPRSFYTTIGPMVAPNLYVPISDHVSQALDSRNAPQFDAVGRRRRDMTDAQTIAALRVVAEGIERRFPVESAGLTRGLRAVSPDFIGLLSSDVSPAVRLAVFSAAGGLYAAVALVLLIACANVAGLLLARAIGRDREMSVRVALGATRSRIVQQLLAESFVVAVIGCSFGTFLSWAAMAWLPRASVLVEAGINVIPPSTPLGYSFALIILVTFAAGGVPALRVSQTVPALGIRQPDSGLARWSLARTLVAVQIAVCFVLLTGSTLLLLSIMRQRALEVGFDTTHTISVEMRLPKKSAPSDSSFSAAAIRALVESIPGVQSATEARYLPLGFLTWRAYARRDQERAGDSFAIDIHPVGPRYLETMQIPLERGRDFASQDLEIGSYTQSTPVIVNHTLAARYFASVDPVGRMLWLETDPGRGRNQRLRIIGVARDSKLRSLSEDPFPVLYLPEASRSMVVRVTGAAAQSARGLERALRIAFPGGVISATPMSDQLAFALLPARIASFLLMVLGGLGLILAMTGLHGVISYTTARRTFEIGIRRALGASRAAILKTVLHDALVVVVIGSVAGGLLAAVLTRILWPLLAGDRTSLTPAALAVVFALIAAVGVLAALRPALRAANVDPVMALRHD
jgi:predicted permease